MNSDDILNTLEFIESNYPVSDVVFKSEKVWPVLRNILGYGLTHNYPYSLEKKKKPEKSLKVIAKIILSRVFSLYSINKVHFESDRINAKQSILFVITPEELPGNKTNGIYNDNLNNKLYSKYIDPYFEVLSKEYETKKIHISVGKDSLRYFNQPEMVTINNFNRQLKLNFWNNYLDFADFTDQIERLNIFFSRKNIPFRFDPDTVITQLNIFFTFIPIFRSVLNHFATKQVVFECYYHVNKMALISVCKHFNIKTIDIQHGGTEQFCYVPWKGNDFNRLLPDYYWAWSVYDSKLLSKYNVGSDVLKPVIAGNMWHKKFYNHEIPSSPDFIELEKKCRQYSRVILISLQYTIGLMDKFKYLISNSPEHFFWLVRFHPMQYEQEKKDAIRFLADYKNVDYKIATSEPHLYLLKLCEYHVTHSSTVSIEALTLGVKSIFVDKMGCDYYKDWVDNNLILFELDPAKVLGLLTEGFVINNEKASDFLILSDEKSALRAVSETIEKLR